MISSQFVSRITLLRDKVESFDQYPFSLPLLRDLEQIDLHPHVNFFVGENGSGKSTLLEAIAVSLGFNAEGGSMNFSFGTRASHSDLHRYLRIAKGLRRPRDGYFLRAESFFNVATEIEKMDEEPCPAPPIINSYGGRSLHEQSHGESFMALMTERFGGQGLYILDEPEAALSPRRQLATLARMRDLVEEKSQFIIATHSPILMAYPDATIFHCGQDGIAPIAYQDTEHFRVPRDFFMDPEGMLKGLLGG
ncbi:putative ATPase [Acidovorax sp. CF316]|uniref:AAA family ATPase n=1 Tax=Acidovorax sp. CF316 TaxID=1144317 RepID=UPI00026BE562|nr:AAA family ATPase [Acidovorax sp. CF316]EJE49957.1 putative ATPase [Acidovorax sp. CF316]